MTKYNLITDIPGVRVGNSQDSAVLTGVTSIVFDFDTVASVTTRGGAPGSRDIALLRPEMSVQGVHAVILSGGSVFGLDAAGGAANFLRSQGIGLDFGQQTVPIVVQAITFDLLNGGNKNWASHPPYWELGWQATSSAAEGDFALGSVGGGFGTTTATVKGGLGSASTVTPGGYLVAAIAVVNAVGSPLIGNGPWFWSAPFENGQEFGGHGLPQYLPNNALDVSVKAGAPPSTTIGLVATNAALTKAETHRLAVMADDGLARALRPAHAPMDGDTVFAVAHQTSTRPSPTTHLVELGAAAADCMARAIARGVFHASANLDGYTGPPDYCTLQNGSSA